jgi:hypothetical protein
MGASFLFAALVFLGSSPVAGHSTFAADSLRLRTMIAQISPGEVNRIAPRGNAMAPVKSLDEPLLLSPFAGVCFTMRTYKVKPTERLQDNESGMRGYSTCQMGSDYRVRSAGGSTSR